MSEEKLYRFISSYFVAGAIVKDHRIVEAAPIIKWMVGKSTKEVREYCIRKGWRVELIRHE